MSARRPTCSDYIGFCLETGRGKDRAQPKPRKLSPGLIAALRVLSDGQPHATSTRTGHGHIAAAEAAGLVKRGLAAWHDGGASARITSAGEDALLAEVAP